MSADHYKKNQARFSEFTDLNNICDEVEDQNIDSEKIESEQLLHRSMSKLSEADREILALSKFQELKYEEIARIMEITVANVKVKVHRAINKFREQYFKLEGQL